MASSNGFDIAYLFATPYGVASLDEPGAYRVEVDIPTSGYDCWLSFEIRENLATGELTACNLNAIRGVIDDPQNTYVCTNFDGIWEPVAGDEDPYPHLRLIDGGKL